MNSLLEKYRVWRLRRSQAFQTRWKRTRSRGKGRYILRFGFLWGACMIVMFSLTEYYFDGSVTSLRFSLVYYSIASPIVGWIAWINSEGRYNRNLLNLRIASIRERWTAEHNRILM